MTFLPYFLILLDYFLLFLRSEWQKVAKRGLGAQVGNLAEMGVFWHRKRSFRTHRANPPVDNAFLGILQPNFTLVALFRSLPHFLLKRRI